MGVINYIKRMFTPVGLGPSEPPLSEPPQRSKILAKVEIYTTPICPYCIRAKALLSQKGIPFEDINVMVNPTKRQEMEQRSGGRTVPQIFIDGKAIGGCDEMFSLDYNDQLDTMLGI